MNTNMKALELTKEGTMRQVTVARPTPSSNQVLIKVKYSAIDTALDSFKARDIDSRFIHDMSCDPLVVGNHFSGTVVKTGNSVKDFKIGDAVFGHLQYSHKTKQGAFSEYITIESDACAHKPSSVDWDIAAASTTETITALQAMRDLGGLAPKKTVLILGAGGGVGGAAIGVARSIGATSITAVCSTPDVERVKALGVTKVVDRRVANLNDALGTYDVIFDVSSKYRIWEASKWLNRSGSFVNTLPTKMDVLLLGGLWKLFSGKSFRSVHCWSKKNDLELIGSWIVHESMNIEIDSLYNISMFSDAWKRHSEPHKRGRVVIKVEDGW